MRYVPKKKEEKRFQSQNTPFKNNGTFAEKIKLRISIRNSDVFGDNKSNLRQQVAFLYDKVHTSVRIFRSWQIPLPYKRFFCNISTSYLLLFASEMKKITVGKKSHFQTQIFSLIFVQKF